MGPSPLTWAHPSSLPLAAWGPIQHSDTSSKKQGCSQTLSSPGLQALPVSPVLSLALSWVHEEQSGHGGELWVLRRTSRMTQRKQGEVFSWQVPPQAATRERFPARGNWSWPPSSSSSGLRLCFLGWRLLCAKTGGGVPLLGEGPAGFCAWGQPAIAHLLASLASRRVFLQDDSQNQAGSSRLHTSASLPAAPLCHPSWAARVEGSLGKGYGAGGGHARCRGCRGGGR